MPVRDRIAGGLTRLAKVFGTAVPPEIEAAQATAGMDTGTPFSPGKPLSPYDGYSRTPRSQNFAPQYNVSARPRSHERVAFSTLKGLIEAYDIAQIAIWHRIDSIRALEWSLVAMDGHDGDVADAVALGMAALAKPDREQPFGTWLGEWLYDVLAFDAGALWRMRNRAGRTVGLRVVDGTTLAPLLDDWGGTPEAPAPAYVQYVNGLPWGWHTTGDLVYQPFRKVSGSPYGRAPLESVLLNANTDLRFQAYFLQRFTEGNIPEAFASAPEGWTPDQIEQFQTAWDALMQGDQEIKSQIKWIPGGGKIEWSNEKDFSDAFSLHLLRKTFAAYHVVPSDAGFTQEINKSSGETQSDVQHRLGDVPLAKHVSGVITSYLQDDLRLPLKHVFDFGEEQDDRLQTAQADDIYAKMGAVSVSTIRELRYGLPEPDGKSVPRFIFSNRGGPVPLSALNAVAGPIDDESGAPEPGAPLPHKVFQPVEGVEAQPPTPRPPLAVELYGPDALPDAAPQSAPADSGGQVAKDGPTAGITTATGITSYDLIGRRDDEDDDEAVAKELAAYRRFAKARRRDGRWRDFQFDAVDAATARGLNEAGRLSVLTKQNGVPGLTGRSGMISLDLPPGLVPTVPGGVADHHITVVYLGKDLSDEDFDSACERTEAAAGQASGPLTGTIAGVDTFPPSTGSDGKTPAFVPVTLPGVDTLRAALEDLSASEHTDYHPHVTLAYLDEGDPLPDPVPPTLVTFTHLTVHRGEQARSFPLGPRTLGPVSLAKAATLSKAQARYRDPSDRPGRRCGNCAMFQPGAADAGTCTLVQGAIDPAAVCDHWQAPPAAVAKADGPDPKAGSPQDGEPPAQQWPGWQLDLDAAAYWAPLIAAALTGAVSARALAEAFLRDHPGAAATTDTATAADQAARALTPQATEWAARERDVIEAALERALRGLWSDGYLIGATSAQGVIQALDAGRPLETAAADTGAWAVGDTEAAQLLLGELGQGDGLRELLDREQIRIKSIADSRLDELGRHLAAGAARGDSADTIAADITALLSNPARAQMIAATELARAVSAGTVDGYKQSGVTHAAWSTAYDLRVCPACDANEAEGAHELGIPFTSGAVYPPQHPMCFPAGVVVTGPSAVAASSRRYEGDLVTVVFADGQEVPVTPNHPVLTPDGWVAAGDLREGSQVLRARDPDRVTSLVCPDDRQAVSRIEDVAASLRETGPVATGFMPVSAEDFHGDGAGDYQVEVVSAAWHTVGNVVSEVDEQRSERGLASAPGLAGVRSRDIPTCDIRHAASTKRLVRPLDHGAPLGRGGVLPAQLHCLRTVPSINAHLAQHSIDRRPLQGVLVGDGLNRQAAKVVLNETVRGLLAAPVGHGAVPECNSSPDEVLPECLAPDPTPFRALGDGESADISVNRRIERVGVGDRAALGKSGTPGVLDKRPLADVGNGSALLDRFSGLVGIERIVQVRRKRGWVGHVYNLETSGGWYFANGIIAHNCRCALIPSVSADV